MTDKLKRLLDALDDLSIVQLPITENPQAAYLCLKSSIDAVNQIKSDVKTLMETHVLVEKNVMLDIANKGPVWVVKQDESPPTSSKKGMRF